MQLKNLTILSGALLFVVPIAHAQTGTGTTGNSSNSTSSSTGPTLRQLVDAAQQNVQQTAAFDQLFFIKAAQGNMSEVMTGQLAQQKSKNEDVRRLAAMLVSEHGLANTELTGVIRKKGLPIPSTVGAMHQATFEQLNRTKNRDFDAMFLAAQVEAHENTITLYQQAIQNSSDPQARDYAQRYLPRIVGHTQQIYDLARRLNAPGIAERPLNPPTPAGITPQTTMNHSMMGTGTGTSGTNSTNNHQ